MGRFSVRVEGGELTETIKLSDLQPDNHNANKGTERGRLLLEKSLHQYGAGRSILLDKHGRIIAGNKTAQTAGEIGIDDVIVVRTKGDKLVAVLREDLDLSDDESGARMLAYADNRVGQADLEWDAEALLADMTAGFNLDEFWFEDELKDIFADVPGYGNGAGEPGDAEPQTNRAEELRQEWGVKPGQLWRLPSRTPGQEHRLICGDCTDTAVVERVMGGEKAVLGLNDPPYNVAQDTQLYAQNRSKSLKDLANSDWDKGFEPVPALAAMKQTLKDDAWCYVFTAHNLFGQIFDWMNQAYAKTSFCVWCKPNPMPSLAKNTWTFGVELCLYGKNGSPVFNYPDGEHCLNWWPFAKSSDGSHPTQKTLQVIEHIVKHCSSERDLLSDLFSGSGTTIIAAENLSRQCRACEISPAYVAVALQRYYDAFGITPELVTDETAVPANG